MIPQIESLSPQEKLELVDELWKSIGNDLSDRGLSEQEKALLDTRWADYLSDPALALSLAEFELELKTLRGSRRFYS